MMAAIAGYSAPTDHTASSRAAEQQSSSLKPQGHSMPGRGQSYTGTKLSLAVNWFEDKYEIAGYQRLTYMPIGHVG